jgi:hypothetical protein
VVDQSRDWQRVGRPVRKSVRFTEKGATFDVPMSEARELSDQLALMSGDVEQPDVTTPAGGLATVIREVIESDRPPGRDLEMDGYEPDMLVTAISVLIGQGAAGRALIELRDSILAL